APKFGVPTNCPNSIPSCWTVLLISSCSCTGLLVKKELSHARNPWSYPQRIWSATFLPATSSKMSNSGENFMLKGFSFLTGRALPTGGAAPLHVIAAPAIILFLKKSGVPYSLFVRCKETNEEAIRPSLDPAPAQL